jgi:3-oxoacyl-[acyl-carrier-protein] synthase III
MTAPLPVRIAGIGAYLPERTVGNAELETQMGLNPGWIQRRTGVLERRYATDETTVSQAVAASHIALARAGLQSADVDAIIGASSAPQQAIPCTAALVQAALEAPDGGSACWDVNATCLSFLVALHGVAQSIALGQYRNVLVFSSEIASGSLNPSEPESATLFGDAAVAVLLQPALHTSSLVHGARFQTFSSGANATRLLGGGTLHRPQFTHDAGVNLFHMDGPKIFRHALQHMQSFMDGFLSSLEWQPCDVDAFVPHQASRHGVAQVSTRLGFTPSQVISNLETRGNCVAASIPLALCEAIESGRIGRGDRVMLAGTAAGLTFGALALTY